MNTETDNALHELEDQLSALLPASMPSDMIARMERAMDNWVETPLHSTEPLEQELQSLEPTTMSDAMHQRLTDSMENWHRFVPEAEKVVPLSGKSSAAQPKQKAYGGMFSAAAAVALLGAAAALVLPHFDKSNQQTATQTPHVAQPQTAGQGGIVADDLMDVSNTPRDAWLMHDGLSTKVTNTTDRGIVLGANKRPHRCIHVEYEDQIRLLDAEGREVEIKRPGVNIVLIPVDEN